MTAVPAELVEILPEVAPQLVRLTVDQVARMIAAAILPEGGPMELIDGVLLWKDRAAEDGDVMAHGVRRASAVQRLQALDHAVHARGCTLQVQLPVLLSPTSAPEPDLAVARGSREAYAQRHPGPADLLLVIEVADHSLSCDRSVKQRLYARAGIERYVLVNLPGDCVELYLQPLPDTGRYARRVDYRKGDVPEIDLGPAGSLTLDAAAVLGR